MGNVTPKVASNVINTVFFVIGMAGVWHETHSLWALFFTLVAALHFSFDVHVAKKPYADLQ